MNQDWRIFLDTHAASGDSATSSKFAGTAAAYAGAEPACSVIDLSHNGIVGVTGEDAGTFLQGQLTCDVRRVKQERSLLGAYLSPKGRVLASFRILQLGDEYLMQVPGSALEPTIERLRMFVLRSRIRIADRVDTMVTLGIVGSDAQSRIEGHLGRVPEAVDDAVTMDGLSVVRVPGLIPRFEACGTVEAAKRLWTALAGTRAGADSWELQDIRCGLPSVGGENADTFVPQMLNLELVDGVSFTKGCYSGQEVVARTQYLGRAKRRMFRVLVSADKKPRVGGTVTHDGGDVGRIVRAAPRPEGGFEVLAVLQTAVIAESKTLRLGDDPVAELQPRELPYALPNEA